MFVVIERAVKKIQHAKKQHGPGFCVKDIAAPDGDAKFNDPALAG